MSGGGGGPIVIKRNKIRASLKAIVSEEDVRAAVPADKLDQLDAILAKPHEDWDDAETHFVKICVGDSYDG